MKVLTRDFDPDTDTGFIYGTWSKGVYFGGLHPHQSSDKKRKWFSEHYGHVTKKLQSAQIKVAYLENSPEVLIGYAVAEDGCFDWIFIKANYREQQITWLLMKALDPVDRIDPNQLTKAGQAILAKHPLEEAI
jgi:hypothetical protein